MATNFEFYKDEILEVARSGDTPMLTKNGQIRGCKHTQCDCCTWENGECRKDRFEWLYAEHIEQPKLTKRERAFCEAVQTGWIARNCDMELCYFKNEPILLKGVWSSQDGLYVSFRELNLQDPFMFIRDTDADCWSVEDLLKLEVEA